GLPIASQNAKNWPLMRPLLANPSLRSSPGDIASTRDAFRELLRVRDSSGLFRMKTLDDIQANLQFLNNGPQQIPGVIVMRLDANQGDYGLYRNVLVVFNGLNRELAFQNDALKGLAFRLHPVLSASSDPVVQKATYSTTDGAATVPAITTAVFVNESQ